LEGYIPTALRRAHPRTPKVGYTPDNPLAALIVGYYEGDKLMFASKVRNGFVPRLGREVWRKRKLKEFETGTCPFANLPEKKRTQWALTGEQMRD
jgi:hypothetical protein